MATTLKARKSTLPQHFVFTSPNPQYVEMPPFKEEKSHKPALPTVLILTCPNHNDNANGQTGPILTFRKRQ